MHRIYLILIIVAIFLPTALFAADSVPADKDDVAFGLSPKEIHQWLWENELRPRLDKLQKAEMALAEKTASNWQEYDMFYYRIELDIDDVSHIIYGRTGIHGLVKTSVLDSVVVNFSSNLTIDSVYNETGILTYTHNLDLLKVDLDKAHVLDEEFGFTVVYHGTPAASSGFLGLEFSSRDGLPLITTLSEPMGARSWWPCNDITTDKADSVDMIVTVDNSLVVSSNGLIQSDVDNGNGTHTVHWKETYTIATYLVSLGIHPYAVWGDWYHYSPTDSMALSFFVYPDHDAYSRPYFAVLSNMIGILAGRYGEYPFIDEKYGCTHFNWGGAMEHQTNTSTTSSSFGYSQPVIVHELGHQWWGDMVTCGDWHHIWINEGFAVYSEALYFEGLNGIDYYHDYMNGFEYTSGGSIYIDDTTDVWNIFGSIVYDKGGWVLHMLRHVVGDDAFFQALADYRAQYQWSSATTEQFRDVVEISTGMELDWFFDQWIYGTYRPNYRSSYVSEADPSGGYNAYLHIRQLQATTPTVFTMPIDVYLETASGTEIQSVFNDQREQNFILHTDEALTDLDLDLDHWISRIAISEQYTLHIVSQFMDDGGQFDSYDDTVEVRGGYDDYLYEVISGSLPPGLSMDENTGQISGTPSVHGEFAFMVRATDQLYAPYKDSTDLSITISAPADRPGDANADGAINLGDAAFIINYIFYEGATPAIMNWADANGDCQVNLADASYLINYIFYDGPVPVLGCVE